MSNDENENDAAANFTGSQPGGFTRLFIDENIYSPCMFTDPPNYFGNVPDSQPGNNSTPRAGQSSAPRQAQKKRQPMKWTWPEDKRLICCWLNTSKDAIKGNDRTASTFWILLSVTSKIFYSGILCKLRGRHHTTAESLFFSWLRAE